MCVGLLNVQLYLLLAVAGPMFVATVPQPVRPQQIIDEKLLPLLSRNPSFTDLGFWFRNVEPIMENWPPDNASRQLVLSAFAEFAAWWATADFDSIAAREKLSESPPMPADVRVRGVTRSTQRSASSPEEPYMKKNLNTSLGYTSSAPVFPIDHIMVSLMPNIWHSVSDLPPRRRAVDKLAREVHQLAYYWEHHILPTIPELSNPMGVFTTGITTGVFRVPQVAYVLFDGQVSSPVYARMMTVAVDACMDAVIHSEHIVPQDLSGPWLNPNVWKATLISLRVAASLHTGNDPTYHRIHVPLGPQLTGLTRLYTDDEPGHALWTYRNTYLPLTMWRPIIKDEEEV